MDDFKGTNYVVVQPGDKNIPIMMRLKPCSASTANDGAIPYGSTISSATYSVYDQNGNSVSTSLITNTRTSSNDLYAYLSYTTELAEGQYKITATVTCSLSGMSTTFSRDFDFNRVYMKNY